MKKIVTLGILMICLLVAVRMTTFANAESIEEVSFVDADDVVDEKNVERGDSGIIEDMLKEEEDIQYYAYLTLDDADPSLAPVIIEARNRIIFRQSWVADGLKGYEVIGVLSKGANINLGGHEVSLDRYLVMPSFDIEEDPINAEDDTLNTLGVIFDDGSTQICPSHINRV